MIKMALDDGSVVQNCEGLHLNTEGWSRFEFRFLLDFDPLAGSDMVIFIHHAGCAAS